MKDLVGILTKIALRLVNVFIISHHFRYPEPEAFRYTYLAFTIIVGVTDLLTYCEAIAKLVEVTLDKMDSCMVFHEYFHLLAIHDC